MATKTVQKRRALPATDEVSVFDRLEPIPLEPIPLELDLDHLHTPRNGADASLDAIVDRFRHANTLGIDLERVVSILDLLNKPVASPWAILVVAFKDDPTPSPSLSTYEKVFTAAGTGTMNMVDYFADMSHGKLDASGSRVFGPYILNRPRSDYVGNVYPAPEGKLNRNGVLDLARATATTRGVDLSQFVGAVVCGTPALDLCGWIGGFAALCDDGSIQPSLLGQEMLHGYGLDHSRREGSTEDYADPWDTMSTANAFMAAHPTYGAVGPGLNATNMRLRGWLNENWVRWVPRDAASHATYTIRPLHARHLPGDNAISVGAYTVEFRVRSGWDAGIPRSCVLIHRPDGEHSVVMAGTSGNHDLVAGDEFEQSGLYREHVKVHVDSIDERNQTATLSVTFAPVHIPDIPVLVGREFGGVAVDGGGFVVIGGKVIKVPPRGPVHTLMETVAALLQAESNGALNGPMAQQVEMLAPVLRAVGDLARDLQPVSETPPGAQRLRPKA